VLIADLGGFWKPLLSLFAHMRGHGFIRPELEVRYLVAERIDDIIPMLQTASERRPIAKARLDPRF
jgi:predicted Rossmann-fold nucleotide-binding protein